MPGLPDRHDIEPQPHHDQEFIIRGWIGRQSDEIEDKEEGGNGNIGPPVDWLPQAESQYSHDHRDDHNYGDPKPHSLRYHHALDLASLEVTAENADHITQEIGQHQSNPNDRKFYLHIFHFSISFTHLSRMSGVSICACELLIGGSILCRNHVDHDLGADVTAADVAHSFGSLT
jgi:hypothetical protein